MVVLHFRLVIMQKTEIPIAEMSTDMLAAELSTNAEVLHLKCGYSCPRWKGLKSFRAMTFDEVTQLRYGNRIEIMDKNVHVRTVKINGAPKTWKRTPGKCVVPWKYGMYEYGTFSYHNYELADGNMPLVQL